MAPDTTSADDVFDRYPSFLPGTDRRLGMLTQWILDANVVGWFTGAGISTKSGLPDYRGPQGVWTCKEKGLRPPQRQRCLEEIEPNAAHLAILELERMGKCDFLISQNVDNLHVKSGYPIEKLAELHGNRTRVRCRPCGQTYAIDRLGIEMADLKLAKKDNRSRHRKRLPWKCPKCGRFVEDSVINFGDPMPECEVKTAREWARRADLMIVVGSTCMVEPAASVPRIAKSHGARLVVMNQGETGIDDLCDLEFRHEDVSELLPRLVEKVRSAMKAG